MSGKPSRRVVQVQLVIAALLAVAVLALLGELASVEAQSAKKFATETPTSTRVVPTATNTPRSSPTATSTLKPSPTATRTPGFTLTFRPTSTSTAVATTSLASTATPTQQPLSSTATPTPSPTPPRPTPTPTSPPANSSPSRSGGQSSPSRPKATFAPTVVSVAGVTVSSPPAAPAPVAPVAPAAPPPDDQATAAASVTTFGQDFAALQAALPDVLGQALEPEHPAGDGCDLQQLTTTGLAYVQCLTGTVGFSALPDGTHHWAWTPNGAAEWFGTEPDPPDGATLVSPAAAAPAQVDAACLTGGADPATVCPLADGASVLGYLSAPGATNTYVVRLGASSHMTAVLDQLPADYDLYLVDASSQILAQSVQDGTVTEVIDTDLASGTYYVYVHVDPGRDVDAADAYRLSLNLHGVATGDAPTPAEPPAVATN